MIRPRSKSVQAPSFTGRAMQVDLLSPALFRQVFEQLDAFEGDAVDPDEAKDGDELQLTPDERADSPAAATTER